MGILFAILLEYRRFCGDMQVFESLNLSVSQV